jgi:8-oxo-dGTP pyrophosphatase MutT (NUDIX family)
MKRKEGLYVVHDSPCDLPLFPQVGEQLMYTPHILCWPPLPLHEIHIEVSGDVWTASTEYDALVESVWAKMRVDQPLWDGNYYRVMDPTELTDDARVRLGIIAYRYIATFRTLHEQHMRYGLKALYHLSTSALVRTSDGFYVFGKRAQNGMADLLGGGVQPEELAVACGADLEENLYKELLEEAGLSRSDVEQLTGMGVIISGTSNVILMALAHLNIGCGEVEARFSSRTEDEMAELEFVPEVELQRYLDNMADYRKLISNLL